MADPEDILAESLQYLYDYVPIAHSSAGSLFTYRPAEDGPSLSLITPDTQSANWTLHATSIWSSALYVADHIDDLYLEDHLVVARQQGRPLRIVELGAGAGLPSILISKISENIQVTCTDYPDEFLIRTLEENVRRNDVVDRCRVVPYAWGSDPLPVMLSQSANIDPIPGFDVVLAADTLWNSVTHPIFVQTLQMTLKKSPDARIYLIAGLHTGRYVIQSFLRLVAESGFVMECIKERRIGGTSERPWSIERADGEDDQERRCWIVWMVFRWSQCSCE